MNHAPGAPKWVLPVAQHLARNAAPMAEFPPNGSHFIAVPFAAWQVAANDEHAPGPRAA